MYLVPEDGRENPVKNLDAASDADVALLLKRACIYVFKEENESRMYANERNSYLMENESLRERAFLGRVPAKMGRVFPKFIPDYIENGGHLIKAPDDLQKRLGMSGYRGFGGIDQGGRHATAMAAGVATPETMIGMIYDEYVRTGVPAAESAYDARDMMPPGINDFWWGYDPAMENKRYDQDTEYSTIMEYEKVLANLMAGDRGDAAYEYVNSLLEFRDGMIGGPRLPGLLVFDNAEQTIEVLNKLTWKMVKHQRDNWMVDLGDALKIALSIFRKMGMNIRGGDSPTIVQAPNTYSRRFA